MYYFSNSILQSAFYNLGHLTLTYLIFYNQSLLFTLIKTEITCKYKNFFVTLHSKSEKSVEKTQKNENF
jgi:hypothetical protein